MPTNQPADVACELAPTASARAPLAGGNLTGHVAIVTGGGRGIGRAMAHALAMAGTAVTVASRSAEQLTETVRLIERAGGRALALVTDVTQPCAVAQMVEATEHQLGPVDLLVNNAGITGPIGPLWDVDPDEWWGVVDVHLRGTFLCTRAVLARMIPRRQGRIINVVGGGAARARPVVSGYGCAKAAVVRMTDSLAVETRPYNIPIFALYPSLVRTTITEKILESEAGQRWMPEARTWVEEERFVPPERAAQVVVFLAAGHGDGLSGRCLYAHYDVAALAQRAEAIQRDDLYALQLREE